MTLRLTSPRRRRADARSGQGADPQPPRLADALLTRVLPTGKSGESILGDLREEFREILTAVFEFMALNRSKNSPSFALVAKRNCFSTRKA